MTKGRLPDLEYARFVQIMNDSTMPIFRRDQLQISKYSVPLPSTATGRATLAQSVRVEKESESLGNLTLRLVGSSGQARQSLKQSKH